MLSPESCYIIILQFHSKNVNYVFNNKQHLQSPHIPCNLQAVTEFILCVIFLFQFKIQNHFKFDLLPWSGTHLRARCRAEVCKQPESRHGHVVHNDLVHLGVLNHHQFYEVCILRILHTYKPIQHCLRPALSALSACYSVLFPRGD